MFAPSIRDTSRLQIFWATSSWTLKIAVPVAEKASLHSTAPVSASTRMTFT